MITSSKRKKVNFMIDEHTMMQIVQWIPAGERSDFVNHVLEEAVKNLARKTASDMMDKIRRESHIKMSDKEILEAIEYGRK